MFSRGNPRTASLFHEHARGHDVDNAAVRVPKQRKWGCYICLSDYCVLGLQSPMKRGRFHHHASGLHAGLVQSEKARSSSVEGWGAGPNRHRSHCKRSFLLEKRSRNPGHTFGPVHNGLWNLARSTSGEFTDIGQRSMAISL